jgi:hypothetical protein
MAASEALAWPWFAAQFMIRCNHTASTPLAQVNCEKDCRTRDCIIIIIMLPNQAIA